MAVIRNNDRNSYLLLDQAGADSRLTAICLSNNWSQRSPNCDHNLRQPRSQNVFMLAMKICGDDFSETQNLSRSPKR